MNSGLRLINHFADCVHNPPARVLAPKPSETIADFHAEDKSRNPRLVCVSKPDGFGNLIRQMAHLSNVVQSRPKGGYGPSQMWRSSAGRGETDEGVRSFNAGLLLGKGVAASEKEVISGVTGLEIGNPSRTAIGSTVQIGREFEPMVA